MIRSDDALRLSARTAALLCAFSAAVTFAVCWFLVMERSVTERHREHFVFVGRVESQRVEAERSERHAARDVVTVRTIIRTTAPDTTVTERIDERIEDKARSSEKTERVEAEVRVETQYVDRLVETERIVTPAQPRWSVGAGVGLDVFQLSPVYQVDAAYRLIGPVSVGGFVQLRQADLAPTVGVGLRVAF